MRRVRSLPLAVLATMLAAGPASCVSGNWPGCVFSCDDGVCPEGYSCGADAHCHRSIDDAQCMDHPSACSSNCPQEMTPVPVAASCVCVDRFEASPGDAGAAASRYGASPWVNVTWEDARTACELAGKRLCTADEWTASCAGPLGTAYPYGDGYDPAACNVYSAATEGTLIPTGTWSTCAGGYAGLFDMSGNVWEWTATCTADACQARGGSSSATDGESDLSCGGTWEADPTAGDAYLGFRCCLTP